MNTISEKEYHLLECWEDTGKRYDTSIETHTKEELLMTASLAERDYVRFDEEVKVPHPQGGYVPEHTGLRLTEKGLLALRKL